MVIVSGTPCVHGKRVSIVKPGFTIFTCYTEKEKNYPSSAHYPMKSHTMGASPAVRSHGGKRKRYSLKAIYYRTLAKVKLGFNNFIGMVRVTP